MTRDELLAKLKGWEDGDAEVAHLAADLALLDFIDDDEIRAAFLAIHRWYS